MAAARLVMRRAIPIVSVLLAALTVPAALPGGPAHAFSPDGETVEITDFGGNHGFSLGLFGLDAPQRRTLLGETPGQSRSLAIEASWARGGFWLAVSAGQDRYVRGGADVFDESSFGFVGVRLGHDLAEVSGGVLSLQLTGWQPTQSSPLPPDLGFRLGWSKRF